MQRATVLGYTVPVATTRRARLLGLAFLDRFAVGEGLLLPGCRSVHTFGMLVAVDVLFLDAEGQVIEVRRGVPPRRAGPLSGGRLRSRAPRAREPAVGGDFQPRRPQLAVLPEIEELATVLVCEDDDPTRELLCDHLTADRYRALPAPSAADALRLCGYNHPVLM